MNALKTALRRTWKWCYGWLTFQPHVVVGGPDAPYMLRWHVIPRNPWFNIYLHKFLRDDDDRARHDHPWRSLSIVLAGEYIEDTPSGRRHYKAGSIIRRTAEHTHRIELINNKPAWTLFITGRKTREWGFHCPQGWRSWEEFVDTRDHGAIGRGCA